jgi:hypothetical protein
MGTKITVSKNIYRHVKWNKIEGVQLKQKLVTCHSMAVVYCVTIDATALGVSLHVALTLIKQNFITDYCRKVTQPYHIL